MPECQSHIVFHEGCDDCTARRSATVTLIRDALDMCDDVLGVEALI